MEFPHLLMGLAVAAIVGYLLGLTKGRPSGGAIMGLLLGPIGWLIVVFTPDGRPTCPHCKGHIGGGATRCKNCGEVIPRCPSCNKQIGLKPRRTCQHCREELFEEDWSDAGGHHPRSRADID